MIICSKLTFWTSEESNRIQGSDGSSFHPLLKKDERIYIFTPDLCRYGSELQDLPAVSISFLMSTVFLVLCFVFSQMLFSLWVLFRKLCNVFNLLQLFTKMENYSCTVPHALLQKF